MASGTRLRIKISRALTKIGFPSDWFLIPLAMVIGALAGLVAMAFDWMVHLSSEKLFGRAFESRLFFEGEQYVLLIVVPALGGLLVGVLTHMAHGKAGGHGIPDVIESLARRQGVLPKRSVIYKALTASLTLGSGGSAGVEGPIIQIGSALASAAGQILRVGREHMHTLVGCGAAGAMAAIFNAPIAGVLFVLEVILRDFSHKTFMPIVIASVFGTAVAQTIGGGDAVFSVPDALQGWELSLSEIGLFVPLGILCGLVGVLFTKSMVVSQNFWDKVKLHKIVKPMFGGAMLGVLGTIYVLLVALPETDYGLPEFFGNGYPVIEWLFEADTYTATPALTMVGLLTLTLLFKIVGTCFTISSGGSGGILAPSLFMGAMLGGAFGSLLQSLGWFGEISPAVYALAGMAGVLTAAVHCPLTAFLLIFELTKDIKTIMPVMLVAIFATTCAQVLTRQTIYSFWLGRLGLSIGTVADITVLRRLYVSDLRVTTAAMVQPRDPAQKLIDLAEDFAVTDYVVCDEDDRYIGMVVGEDVRTTLLQREAVPLLIVGELMRTNLPTVTIDETLDVVLDKFSRHDVASLTLVDDDNHIRGMISRSSLMKCYQSALAVER